MAIKFNILEIGNPLDASAPKKFYARPVATGEVTLEDLASDISHASSINEADVMAVLYSLVREIPRNISRGYIVRLGSLGAVRFSAAGQNGSKQKKGADIRINRFMIEGEGNIKYTHNNGHIAKDPKLAAQSFLNTLEKLPGYINKAKEEIADYEKDLPVLKEVVNATWAKEDKLHELKTELDAVERRILLSITPVDQNDGDDESEEQGNEKANGHKPETTKETNATEAHLHDIVAKTGMQDKVFIVKPKF